MEMRIGVIGDIHGRTNWKDIVATVEVDYWVFMGDYVDSFDYSNVEILHNLKEIIRFRELNPETILLIGNHDFQYMYGDSNGFSPYTVTGFRPEAYWDLYDIFTKYSEYFQFAHADSGYLFTHAGVVNKWWKKYKQLYQDVYERYFGETTEDIVELLNITSYKTMLLNAMSEVGRAREGAYGNIGSPIWADQSESRFAVLRGYHHVVGHTPQRGKVTSFKVDNDCNIYYVDALASDILEDNHLVLTV